MVGDVDLTCGAFCWMFNSRCCWIPGLFILCVCVETYAFIYYDHLEVSALVICFLVLKKYLCIWYVLFTASGRLQEQQLQSG